MADPTTTFKIKAIVEGGESVEKLKRSAKALSSTAKQSGSAIATLRNEANKLGRASNATENEIRTQISVLKELRSNVSLTGKKYQLLTRDIGRAQRALAKSNKTSRRSSTGFKAAAGGFVGAAASGMGSSTLQLAGIGALAGGPTGGAIGAALGGVMDLSGAAASAAQYAASVSRLEIALQAVTKSAVDFAKAQSVISDVSDELNIPIGIATRQFTTLSASVIGAGGSVKDTELVFRGVSEAIKATGGEAHDIQSAIRAMSQIFGKGKVSAEELQGQLGERLPGAVVKFAKATGRTLPQLQKDLRDGTVGLNDTMKFVVALSEEHRDAALEMADSTEEAGQRMDVALKNLRRKFGEFFKPVGAGFQDIITDLANMTTAAIDAGKILTLEKELRLLDRQRAPKGSIGGIVGPLPDLRIRGPAYHLRRKEIEEELRTLRAGAPPAKLDKNGKLQPRKGWSMNPDGKDGPVAEKKNLERLAKLIARKDKASAKALAVAKDNLDITKVQIRLIKEQNPLERERIKNQVAIEKITDKYNLLINDSNSAVQTLNYQKAQAIALDAQELKHKEELSRLMDEIASKTDPFTGFKEGIDRYIDSVKELGTQLNDLSFNTFKKLEDALFKFVTTGIFEFRKFASSVIADMTRIAIRQSMLNFTGWFKNIFGFKDGGAFAQNGIQKFARGGVISKPTMFKYGGSNLGIAGESGPEAILPLRRGSSGRLGVEAQGGAPTVINIDVDASGSSVEGQSEEAARLGKALSLAVQNELIKQRAPGGLLN